MAEDRLAVIYARFIVLVSIKGQLEVSWGKLRLGYRHKDVVLLELVEPQSGYRLTNHLLSGEARCSNWVGSSSYSAEASQAQFMLGVVSDVVNQLLATEVALDKLGVRGISAAEAQEALWNRHVLIKNRRGSSRPSPRDMRRLLIGTSDGGRRLTLVIENTVEPTTWLLVTVWESTAAERMILEKS